MCLMCSSNELISLLIEIGEELLWDIGIFLLLIYIDNYLYRIFSLTHLVIDIKFHCLCR